MPGEPLRLVTGLRFDVLDVPVEAGAAALWRLGPDSPVAVRGDRMRLLVAAGSAEELPGLLDWLEWGALAPALDLVALGADGHMEAPSRPGERPVRAPLPGAGPAEGRSLPPGRSRPLQGAAVWLRPPEPGCEVEASLPTLSAVGASGTPLISYDSWTRWPLNATGSDCGARALSRWPSRRPREWTREHGRGR